MTLSTARLIRILLAVMMVGYTLFFSIQLILHFHSFGSRALDLGNMGQSIWNTAQGDWFHQTNQPGAVSRLSLHVEPLLVPISLLYWLYPGPEILFIFQSIVVALGAIPAFALAKHALNSEWLGLLFALLFLLMPAIQAATLLDFHAIALAPTFMLAAFYYLETRRPALFALFAILTVACKEDMTLLVMMMGLYALLINRQWRLGLTTLGLTATWAFLAVFVIPPAFAGTENIHWDRYGHLGDSPLTIVLNMAMQPQLFINHLINVDAVGYFTLLLAPTAYTALFNPVTLLLALPSLGINLLSNFPPMQEINSLIYAAPIVPAVLISSIYGLRNLRRLAVRSATRRQVQSPQVVGQQTAHLLGLLILGATLLYHARFGYLPGGGQYRGWEEVTDHHRRSAQIFAQIPPHARLSAQDRLNPHVSQRQTLYIFDRIDDADHIVLDVTHDSWPLHPVALRHRVEQFLADGFGVLAALDGYLLLAKTPPTLPKTLPEQFYDFARVENPATFEPTFPTEIIFDETLELVGYDLTLGAHERFLPTATLYWRLLQPVDEDYTVWPFFMDEAGRIIEEPRDRPLVTPLWYPTSRWQPGDIIQTRTLPYNLAPNIGDRFTLAVGVAANNWDDPAQRLPVTQLAPNDSPFAQNGWVRLNTFERTGRKQYTPIGLEPGEAINPDQPPVVEFWGNIQLLGADVPAGTFTPAARRLPFTLYWQSAAPITVDLTTFAHLVDSSGAVVAQLDWGPQDALGYRPTTSWTPDQPIVDRQQMELPTGLSPGVYTLRVGWYYAPSGERLPVTNPPAQPPADTVAIGQITVR